MMNKSLISLAVAISLIGSAFATAQQKLPNNQGIDVAQDVIDKAVEEKQSDPDSDVGEVRAIVH